MDSRIEHIGIVVKDLEETVQFLENTFQLEVEREFEVPEIGLSARFMGWGDVSVELIQLADPAAREKRLGDAESKIDHIAIQVPDIDAAIAALRAGGGRTETEEPAVLGGRRAIFVEAASAKGVRYQLVEPPA